jgi:ATP-dependent Lon protease
MPEAISVPVLFVTEPIVLPTMVVPIELDDAARTAVDAAQASESGKLLIAPRLDDRYPTYGVLASIVQVGRIAGSGGSAAVVRGERRALIGTGTTGPGAALWVEVTEVEDVDATDETRALAAEYKKLLLAMLQRREAWQIVDFVNKLTDPSQLADTAGYASYLTDVQKRQLLETPDVAERLRALIDWTGDHLAETEVNDKIADDVREGMEKTQKEFLLRQQLAAIRKELGEGEPDGSDDYRSRVEAADLPEKVREAALREVGKLERSSEQSPEGGWIRTWLDTVLDLPWNVTTEDSTDLTLAREVLDADHHGLEDVKDRIVEYLAVRARRAQRGMAVVGGRGSGAVMVLAGPPGVGKTSLGRSIARATGREFVRISLGGVQDEAEIRGHRRTYVGALPGRLITGLKKAGSSNPVCVLDEVDKMSADFSGDPASALLEALDPEQNNAFVDHYLNVPMDLSQVLFIATANRRDVIPRPLLDRMEVIEIPGYTRDDKLAIARDFLIPRQLADHGLTPAHLELTNEGIERLVNEYTAEAGVRHLAQQVASICRAVAVRVASGDSGHIDAGGEFVEKVLGPPKHELSVAEKAPASGIATTLTWTPGGGEIMLVESTQMPGKGEVHLTGKMGDILKESAAAAFSYIRSHATSFGLKDDFLTRIDVHVHLPKGAVPKDGPAMGLSIFLSLLSMLRGIAIRPDVALTGEITLRGKVLRVDGLKQKCLAAHRAGIKDVVLPRMNEPDLEEIPARIREDLRVHFVSRLDEVIGLALTEPLVTEPVRTEPSAHA